MWWVLPHITKWGLLLCSYMLTWTGPCLATSSEEVLTLDGTSMHGDVTEGFLPPTWQANLKQHVLLQSGYSCHGFVAVGCACWMLPCSTLLAQQPEVHGTALQQDFTGEVATAVCLLQLRRPSSEQQLRQVCKHCTGSSSQRQVRPAHLPSPAALWCQLQRQLVRSCSTCLLGARCNSAGPRWPSTACARSNMQGPVRGLWAVQLAAGVVVLIRGWPHGIPACAAMSWCCA